MEEKIIHLLKSRQLGFDPKKAEAEHNPRISRFIEHTLSYPEIWCFLFDWKHSPYPLIIVEPKDFVYEELKDELMQNTNQSFFIRNFAFSFSRQYQNLSDPRKIRQINQFLSKIFKEQILIARKEIVFLCLNCDRIVLTNKVEKVNNRKCNCGATYDFSFIPTQIPDEIFQEIINGHLLELFALRILKQVKNLQLVGMESNGKKVYTSIQYEGAGVGKNFNAEFDLLGVKGNILITVECKFNKTKYDDIEIFLKASDNLYYQIKEHIPELRMKKLIFSYDATNLSPIKDSYIISLREIESIKKLIKEITNFI